MVSGIGRRTLGVSAAASALASTLPAPAIAQDKPRQGGHLRVGDDLAYVTDTPFEPSSIELTHGVRMLFHEAWSSSDA